MMYQMMTHEMFFKRVTLIIWIISLSTMAIIDSTPTDWLAHCMACMAWLTRLVGNQAIHCCFFSFISPKECRMAHWRKKLKTKTETVPKVNKNAAKFTIFKSNRKYSTNQLLFGICKRIIPVICTRTHIVKWDCLPILLRFFLKFINQTNAWATKSKMRRAYQFYHFSLSRLTRCNTKSGN